MNFEVTCLLRVEGDAGAIEPQLDGIMEELCSLGVTDPFVGATLSSGEIEISLTVETRSFEEAVAQALGVIRSAIHAAGGGTPNWRGIERIEVEKATISASA